MRGKGLYAKGLADVMVAPQTHSANAADTTSTTPSDSIIMYTTPWCGDCRRAKRVFADFAVSYDEINIDENDDAAEIVQTLNNGLRSVPTIVFPDGGVLVEPSNSALAAVLEHYKGQE